MRRYFIDCVILLLSFLFVGCNKKQVMFFSPDELISYCESHVDYKKNLSEKELYVTGRVAWISYPKDGKNLNECAIYLETRNSISEEREGDFIACHMLERIKNSFVGETVLISGKFYGYDTINDDKYVIIKKCKIILDSENCATVSSHKSRFVPANCTPTKTAPSPVANRVCRRKHYM